MSYDALLLAHMRDSVEVDSAHKASLLGGLT